MTPLWKTSFLGDYFLETISISYNHDRLMSNVKIGLLTKNKCVLIKVLNKYLRYISIQFIIYKG